MLKLGISVNTPVGVTPRYLRHAFLHVACTSYNNVITLFTYTYKLYTHIYVHTDNKIIILPHNKGLRSSYYFLTEISNWFCEGKIHIFTQLVIQSQITENVSESIYSFRY
jgi:hypothetical protein